MRFTLKCVKILVGDEAEKSLITRLWLEAETVVLQRGRIQMLEAAAAAKVDDERVIVVRQFAEHLVSLFDDLGDIGRGHSSRRNCPRR